MVEEVVISALKKLAAVAVEKGLELYEVSDQIEPMQNDLRLIQASLKVAESNQSTNPLAKEWVNQVRELAYRIDRAMETFLVEIEENTSKSSLQKSGDKCCGCFNKLWTVAKHPLKLNTLSGEIKEIREEMTRIFDRRTQLAITDHGTASEEPDQIPHHLRPTEPDHVDDSEVVGFESAKSEIISHLLNKNISRRTVLSIVGEGGLGKTTLAQKVYKSTEVNTEFGCIIWLSISQKFDENILRREILYSAEPTMKEKIPPVADKDLGKEVKKFLGSKRYLIILDDVWTVNLWAQLKIDLPDVENASRVVITTRKHNIATAADRNTKPYRLDYLNEDESLALLFRKALQQDVQPDNYPSDLVGIAKGLIKKCGRLPLALVVLGGVLSTKPASYAAWEEVYDTLNWHNDHTEKCTQILRMSYQELGHEQKQRFKYFAAFPEDHEISTKHITRMWIAEELTSETQAMLHLDDLVQRCLLQVVKRSWNGYCTICSMHDLLRDLAIGEAKMTNFFTVLSKQKEGNQKAPSSVLHRASLQFCSLEEFDVRSVNIQSMLCFGEISNYQGFRLIKVLVIERVNMSRKKISCEKWLEGLVHLKYLGFRACGDMTEELKNISFSTFKNLETFDCWKTRISVNNSIWKVTTLRHAIMSISSGIRAPLKWDDLGNLQTLKWVKLDEIPELKRNINLRTLKIQTIPSFGSVEEKWQRVEALLSRTEDLVSLALRFKYLPFLTVGTRNLPCHNKVQSMVLSGEWEKNTCVPCVEMFPKYLTKLRLEWSGLEEDPMPTLERLQSLRILKIQNGAYMGTEMICSAGGFRSLENLELKVLPNLSEWEINVGAMPMLSQLTFRECYKLHTLPHLQNVPSLRELTVCYHSSELDRRLRSEDRNKIEHIPSVRISNPRK